MNTDTASMTMTPEAPTTAIDRITSFPEPTRRHSEGSLAALGAQSWIQAWRLTKGWIGSPLVTIQALIYPALTLIMIWIVLGKSISSVTGQTSLAGSVPMMALVGAMSGSVVSGVTLMRERRNGLLSRFWALPIHRAAMFFGQLLAEIGRVVITTIVMILVGVALGFRFTQGFPASVAFFCIPLLFGIGYSTMVTAISVYSEKGTMVEFLSLLVSLMFFFNSGFVPVMAYPQWLQPIVSNQPVTCAVEAMRGLTFGGPVAEPLMKSVAWSVGMLVVFAVPALIGYRRAAQKR